VFYPMLVAFCVIIVVFYTIYKGTKRIGLSDTSLGVASGVAFGCGAVAAGVCQMLIVPWLKDRLNAYIPDDKELDKTDAVDNGPGDVFPDDNAIKMQEMPSKGDTAETSDNDGVVTDKSSQKELTSQSTWTEINVAMDKVVPDVEKRFHDAASDQVLEMLANAEKHDPHAELAFSYLQVFSACFDAFAHGANDVANSIGPMAAVYAIWDTGIVEKKVDMPLWILGMGGVGIVFGLVLYGYNIMQAIGFELTKLSPSRGFSIELGAALVVLTGSRLEIPLSTTHCQVGATVGVGMTEGLQNVNWWLFGRVVFGWIITLVVASLCSAAVFSYAVYAPEN